MAFENYKNPLLSERYETIGDMLGDFKNNPKVVLKIGPTGFYEPDFGSKELNEEYNTLLAKNRAKRLVSGKEGDKEVEEYYKQFYRSMGLKYVPDEDSPYRDIPMFRIIRIEDGDGTVVFVSDGRVLYSSFEVAQKGPDSMVFRHPELKEKFYKSELDDVLPNPYGVSPILLLRSEGGFYIPFGERGGSVELNEGALGVIGGGMGTQGAPTIESLIVKEIKEESPVGVFNLSDLNFLGTVYAGRNPNTLHLETATLVESSLNRDWRDYVSKKVKEGSIYLLNAPTKTVEGKVEHKNIWLVRVHPDNISDLETIANGKVPNVGSFDWAEPHSVAYMLGVDYALKNYF